MSRETVSLIFIQRERERARENGKEEEINLSLEKIVKAESKIRIQLDKWSCRARTLLCILKSQIIADNKHGQQMKKLQKYDKQIIICGNGDFFCCLIIAAYFIRRCVHRMNRSRLVQTSLVDRDLEKHHPILDVRIPSRF